MDDFKNTIPIKTPTLRTGLILLFVYLLGVYFIVIGMKYISIIIGLPKKTTGQLLLNGSSLIQIVLMAMMTFFLLRNYRDYLFSSNWKKKFIKYIIIGFKWSIPLFILHIILLSFSSTRVNLIEDYTSMRIISFKSLSISKLAVFSIWVLLGAIFEELIFRGIFQNKLQKRINPTFSVFLVSLFFTLLHCIHFNAKINVIINWYLIGLLSGFAFKKSSSCISSFIPHLTNNAISIIFIIFVYKTKMW